MKTEKSNLTIFHDSDFPNCASHCEQAKCGFSLYKGVLVQWDEDGDERILTFLDQLDDFIRVQLLIVQEHEGGLALVWKDRVPPGFEVNEFVNVDGDEWSIMESRVPGIKIR